MQIFFHLLEGQRLELQSYAEKCLRQRRYFEGMILSIAARKAIRWGSRFRDEYGDLNSDRA
jgi:hypothetical protein